MVRRRCLFLALICASSLVPRWVPALGQTQPRKTFTRTPASGPPGTAIELRGTGCIEEGKAFATASVALTRASGDAPTARDFYRVQPDGSWAGELLVDFEASEGSYVLSASCNDGNRTVPLATAGFEVTAPPPDVSPTATATPKAAGSKSPFAPTSPSPSPSRQASSTPATERPLASEERSPEPEDRSLPLVLIASGSLAGILGALVALRRRRAE